MLSFATNWIWQVKTFIALVGIVLFFVLLPVLEKKGLNPETAFLCWIWGIGLSFFIMMAFSSISMKEQLNPVWLCVVVLVLGFVVGGPINVLLGQAMSTEGINAVSNSAIPFAVVGAGNSIAYLLVWVGGKFYPNIFKLFIFSPSMFLGLIFIATGIVIVFVFAPR